MASDADHYLVLTVSDFLGILPSEPEPTPPDGARRRLSAMPDSVQESRRATQWSDTLNQLAMEGHYYHSSPSPGLLLFERRD